MNKKSGSTWKLGMFILIGLVDINYLFCGKTEKYLWLYVYFKFAFQNVSGLEVGNNVLFSVNVGTVSEIQLVTDTSVVVRLLIQRRTKFIKSDAIASIGSDGLMGDKVNNISRY
jgi:phospholipid/cholesterol/gamma-HCH transport system substrate-binding protein